MTGRRKNSRDKTGSDSPGREIEKEGHFISDLSASQISPVLVLMLVPCRSLAPPSPLAQQRGGDQQDQL